MVTRLRNLLGCGLLSCVAATPAWAQEAGAAATREAGDHQKSNESFFGPWIVLLLLFPIVLTAVLAMKRAKRARP